MDLSGFRETISTRGKILPARSRMVGSVNGKSIIVPRIRLVGRGGSLAHPTINKINVMPPTCWREAISDLFSIQCQHSLIALVSLARHSSVR
jgi:hypothetical protein